MPLKKKQCNFTNCISCIRNALAASETRRYSQKNMKSECCSPLLVFTFYFHEESLTFGRDPWIKSQGFLWDPWQKQLVSNPGFGKLVWRHYKLFTSSQTKRAKLYSCGKFSSKRFLTRSEILQNSEKITVATCLPVSIYQCIIYIPEQSIFEQVTLLSIIYLQVLSAPASVCTLRIQQY